MGRMNWLRADLSRAPFRDQPSIFKSITYHLSSPAPCYCWNWRIFGICPKLALFLIFYLATPSACRPSAPYWLRSARESSLCKMRQPHLFTKIT
jgi:hypothetical protein